MWIEHNSILYNLNNFVKITKGDIADEDYSHCHPGTTYNYKVKYFTIDLHTSVSWDCPKERLKYSFKDERDNAYDDIYQELMNQEREVGT